MVLEDILQSNGRLKSDFIGFMSWEERELAKIEKLTKSELRQINAYFNIDGIDIYLANFQDDYKITKEMALTSYKLNKDIYNKVKHIPSWCYSDFSNGMDILEDISNFLGVDDESKIIHEANQIVAFYRKSTYDPDPVNLFAWAKRGELDFNKLTLSSYNKILLENWINSNEQGKRIKIFCQT